MSAILDLGPLKIERGARTLVMGILNVTPDSFSDGGKFDAPAAARAHARAMLDGGADIIDVGGESTRPGSTPVSAEDELARVLPVLEAIAPLGATISIDTYKADVARRAIGAGAHIINDVWGLQKDAAMADTAAELGVPVIMMHNRTAVDESIDIVEDINTFFARSIALAEQAGIPKSRMVLDPGIGFGKSIEQNLIVLNRLGELGVHDLPVLMGTSRKRFIGHILDAEAHDRLFGTIGSNIATLGSGIVDIVRVHDVKPHVDACRVADAIFRR
ncbi:dihydropteroate synthase [Coralliovum pocilloporae]|uniref:dihydropteroate synthase n=1 Tax=Coralliovum pocilloporae TaxID=3066369 RepID=UPI003306C05F